MRKFNNIAKLMRIKRHGLNLSQNQLADMIGFSSRGQFVSNIERGLCSVPFRKVKTAAAALQIDCKEIINAIIEDEKDFMTEIINGSETAIMTTKEYRQKRIEEKRRKKCEKTTVQTSPALSAIPTPKTETHCITFTQEKPIQNTPRKLGTLSPVVENAINIFMQNL